MALYVRALSAAQGQELDKLINSNGGGDLARRARVIQLSAQRHGVQEISAGVGLHPINVRKWIHRFNRSGVAGLHPRRSPGRPRVFSSDQRQAIRTLACQEPESAGLGFSTWSLQRLRSKLIAEGIVSEISAETIRQELINGGLVFEGRRWVHRTS